MRPFTTVISIAALALSLSSPAWGQADITPANSTATGSPDLQPRAENGRQIYEASQFTRFAPQTALDMVQEIPGFAITALSADRGLGEASQNVLINGQRITGKSNDADTALRRIPVSSIVRLEIADAATFNISGINGQILNVITKANTLQGNFNWRGRVRGRIKPMFTNGEVNISGKLGKGDFTLGLSNNNALRAGGWGPDITRNANGDVLITRDYFNYFDVDEPRLSTTYSVQSDSGSIFNANAAVAIQRTRSRGTYDVSAPGQLPSTEISTNRGSGWNFEGGADYEFALGGGRLKLVGFHRSEHSPTSGIFRTDFANGDPSTGERFDQVVDEGESVLRSEYRWKSGRSDWQASLEGAFNTFDATSALFELVGGNFNPVPLPGATSRVEEKRAQAIITYGRPLSEALSLQASLGGEYSQLRQTGPGGLTRSFIRPKGTLALTWKANATLTISSKLQRKVGQLTFGSFLASVDLQNGNDNGANPQLVPPQSWLLENEANWSLGKVGSIKFKLDGELISDLVDQIAISPTVEAIGNLPSTAKRLRGEINGTFVLDTVGFTGATLDLIVALQKTRVRDALLINRPLSNRSISFWSVAFRHDLPGTDLVWGFSGQRDVSTQFYRLDYQSREINASIVSSLFVEHKDILGLKIRATAQNLFNQKEKNREIFYLARRDGPIDFTRATDIRWGPLLRVTVSGTF
jgi:outer membrane receptor for ferrienterochelin and colicins